MKIPAITKKNVLDAFRDLDEGVNQPRFGKATKYQVEHEGNRYDPKPVVAHAVKHLTGKPLRPKDFSSGEGSGQAVAVLRNLGFSVVEIRGSRNPVWTADEIILALDFYLKHRASMPNKTDASVAELSEELRALSDALGGDLSRTFRNVNGTYMKLMNLRRLDPEYSGAGLKAGGKLEEILWDRYAGVPAELSQVAAAIRESVQSKEVDLSTPLDEEDEEECEEGRLLTRLHRVRERSSKVIKRKKKAFLKHHGKLFCEACGFDFEGTYGERGAGFIECHHIKPVSALKPGEKTKNEDLALLCSNCHRIVHRKKPWLTVKNLAELVGA